MWVVDSALPVVCTCRRQRCWGLLDGDKTRQNQQARLCQWVSACFKLILGPRICQAQPTPSRRVLTLRARYHNPCTNFKVAQPLFGLTPMADFAQGLDASKLILAETVRFFSNSCGDCSSPRLSHTHTYTVRTHIGALLHHQPILCSSVQLSPFSLWSICTREPRSSPSLTSIGKFLSLSTDLHLY